MERSQLIIFVVCVCDETRRKMKTKNSKTYHSKEAVKQKIKQIGMVLSVVTFIKLAFWIVVDAVAFKRCFNLLFEMI